MNDKTIISCAVTGSAPTPEKNPAVPVTPYEIATSAIEAAKAGAAIAHIHVRDPETGGRSIEFEHYREVVERIRDSGSELIINLTTGPGETDPAEAGADTLLMTAADRVRHVEELKPEICSLDVATMNFRDSVFLNAPDILRDMAERITRAGVKAEIEVFDTGHIELARQLIAEGTLPKPAYFQLCLGIAYGATASPEAMMHLRDRLPEGSLWSAFGISRSQFPMVGQAVLLGGHARIGLEDNIYLGPCQLAPSNAALVERARLIIESLGGTVATSAEARSILGLA